jgi:glutathione S-transferase
VFAALNSIEPHAQNLIHFNGDDAPEAWGKKHRSRLEATLNARLNALGVWLGDKDYLGGRFSAGDLVMASVLRELVDCGALLQFPNVDAYRQRCQARPALARALEAQMQVFRDAGERSQA